LFEEGSTEKERKGDGFPRSCVGGPLTYMVRLKPPERKQDYFAVVAQREKKRKSAPSAT